jgi:hypothetical protein
MTVEKRRRKKRTRDDFVRGISNGLKFEKRHLAQRNATMT